MTVVLPYKMKKRDTLCLGMHREKAMREFSVRAVIWETTNRVLEEATLMVPRSCKTPTKLWYVVAIALAD